MEYIIKSQLNMIKMVDQVYKTKYTNVYCDFMRECMTFAEQQTWKILMTAGRDWTTAKHSLLYVEEKNNDE